MTHGQPSSETALRRRRRIASLYAPRALLLAIGAFASTFSVAQASTYLLGPMDVLKIRVFEWRPSAGVAYEWVPLTGEFTVSASGTLSLPIVGTIPVAGKTPEEVGDIIGDQLQQQIGLQKKPNASIEISSYRPFFVTGAVATPGKFNYLPGLTVTQALSMAGGSGSVDPKIMEVQRETLVNQGSMRELDAERTGLIARQARVDAMLASATKINFPRELTERAAQPAIAQLMRNEQALLDSRLRSMQSDVTALEQSKILARNQLEALKQKEESLTKQIDMANKDLSSVNKLVSQGLTVSTRALGATQNVADLESRNLDVSLAILTTQQDLTKLDQDEQAVSEKYKASALTEAADLRDRIAANDEKTKTAQALMLNIQMRVPAAISAMNAEGRPRTITKISRTVNGTAETLVVKDDDLVQPGDVIRVEPQLDVSSTAVSTTQ
ncbi:polysaccharide biosynthesis/export family protein [Neorhizobium sp. NCHU2750]|uniref:polysaccharide biosynthesis/export family protein n=1 Tax=Neorhizobium sp. NCHU2750 TaxID=1825976 RepID=UPI000E7382E1|nr:exopolysaccharide biosynthesis protein [Neorhizobium sp. NCHU2750]